MWIDDLYLNSWIVDPYESYELSIHMSHTDHKPRETKNSKRSKIFFFSSSKESKYIREKFHYRQRYTLFTYCLWKLYLSRFYWFPIIVNLKNP